MLKLLVLFPFIATYGQDSIRPLNDSSTFEKYVVVYGKDIKDTKYAPDAKVSEGYLLNNKKNGNWKSYYPNGVIRYICNYENNLVVGDYQRFYENGKIKETGSLIYSQNIDSIVRYHENGNRAYEAYYLNGLEFGYVKYYYPNGQLEYSYEVTESAKVENMKHFTEDGKLLVTNTNDENSILNSSYIPALEKRKSARQFIIGEEAFTNGSSYNPNGYNVLYSRSGFILQKGEYIDGQLWSGFDYYYNEDGLSAKTERFKNGVLSFDKF